MFAALEKNAYALQMEKNAWGWNDFKAGLGNAWDATKGAVSNVGNAIGNTVDAAKNYGQAALNRGAAAYHTVMGNDAAAAEKMNNVARHDAAYGAARTQAGQNLGSAINQAGNAVTGAVNTAGNAAREAGATALGLGASAVNAGVQGARAVGRGVSDAVDWTGNKIQQGADAVGQAATDAANYAGNVAGVVGTGIAAGLNRARTTGHVLSGNDQRAAEAMRTQQGLDSAYNNYKARL